jgi:hypothetical protein
MDSETKNKERRLRRRAQRQGLTLKKSRAASGNDNLGGYMLLHTERWIAMAGHRFELTLDEVELWLMQHAAEFMP